MSQRNVALGLLASKLDRGELDASEAVERAYQLGLRERGEEEPEPPTMRRPSVSGDSCLAR